MELNFKIPPTSMHAYCISDLSVAVIELHHHHQLMKE